AKIFEPFFTTKEMASGSGLGLASAYGIIKNHEGIITVDSKVGKGTTFDIYLPATDEEKIEIEESPKAEQWKGTGTILFVDDEEGLVNSVRRVLGILGFDVLVASSGNEALEAYEKNMDKIDLIILDMIMPGMSGGAVFDQLKELNPNVKVILSSGYSLEGEAREIMDRGCDGFLPKPFDFDALSEQIQAVLNKK
ncbi:MAG: response regulator, partial [bacterium]